MSLKDKTIVVTGGSRGLGLGLVEALVDHGAKVTVVARDRAALAAVERRLGVATIAADVTEETAAHRILAEVRPDILVLNAGATPRMGPLDQLSWGGFSPRSGTPTSRPGFIGCRRHSTCRFDRARASFVGSSGAAVNGSPLSGGYAGSKRMLWLMAKYANGVAEQKNLRHPLPGNRAFAGDRWDRSRRCCVQRLCPGNSASSARRTSPGSAHRCRRASSATTWSRC